MKTSEQYAFLEKQLEEVGFEYDREAEPRWNYFCTSNDFQSFYIHADIQIRNNIAEYRCWFMAPYLGKDSGRLDDVHFTCYNAAGIRVMALGILRAFSEMNN